MQRPTLQQLAYVVALADAGHFGRAAAACHVTQPALSAQIRELERRLGTTLVERLPRGIRLTPAGDAVVARATHLLRGVDEMMEELGAADGELAGPVVVGAIPTVAPYVLGALVPILVSRFPAAEVRIEELRTDALLGGLRDGRVDLALCALPVDDERFAVATLTDDPFLLALPEGHSLARGRGPVSVDVLAGLRVLLLEDGHCLRDQALSVCDLAGTQPTDARATSLPTLVQMVAAGNGVTLLPASAAAVEARPGNGIAVRRFREPVHRTLGLAWRASSPRGTAYAELARLVRPRVHSARASGPGDTTL
ncbi:MAG: LysR substrate-binding domain-containing protein [Actinomycetota bacterium]